MPSRRKQLREQIAKTENPAVRMQLNELLTRRGRWPDRFIPKIEEALDSLLRPLISRLPDRVLLALFVVLLTIVVLVVFAILEGMGR